MCLRSYAFGWFSLAALLILHADSLKYIEDFGGDLRQTF